MEKQIKICALCERELTIDNFYDAKRSYCVECERKTARNRMRQYGRTIRGKASCALKHARQNIKKNGYDVKDDLTVEELVEAFEFFDTCAYCDKPFESLADISIEHIVPLSKGGDNTISNICIVHKSCNSKKQDRDVAEVFGNEKAAEIKEYTEWKRGDEKHARELEKMVEKTIKRLEGLFADVFLYLQRKSNF